MTICKNLATELITFVFEFLETHANKGKVHILEAKESFVGDEEVQEKFLKLIASKLPAKQTREKSGEVKLTDPDAPKRPLSAYMLFCKKNRDAFKKQFPEMKVTELSKELGKAWTELKASESKKDKKAFEGFNKEAKEAKDAYAETMKSYERPSDEELKELNVNKRKIKKAGKVSKPKKEKDANAPKRNKSAYMFFCAGEREAIKAENPEMKSKEIMQVLGAKWKAVSTATDKKAKKSISKYIKLAEEDKARYEEEKKTYVKSKSVEVENDEDEEDTENDEEEEKPKTPAKASAKATPAKNTKSKSVEEDTDEEEEDEKSKATPTKTPAKATSAKNTKVVIPDSDEETEEELEEEEEKPKKKPNKTLQQIASDDE